MSKSGQGPKTSILLFEKGGQTDWVWFYKVTNDGYTMGTNRKEQAGNQLVDCLNLYHKYVKHGKKPAETKYQFCIPAEWIKKTLDPRVKEKIRTETRADLEAKGAKERKKKEADLNKKVKENKLTEADKQTELKVFDQILENKIQNEIAKRIEKAHNYSFNLANYKSPLSEPVIHQINLIDKINSEKDLDSIYTTLKSNKSIQSVESAVKTLNFRNALEADIAREYVSNMEMNMVAEQPEVFKIKEILKNGAKYPSVSIKDTCFYEKGKFPTQATPEGVFPFVVTAKDRKSADNFQLDAKAVCISLISSTGHGSATLSRIHYQEGKFALADLLFAAIPKSPDVELLPKFLYYILDARREELFCPLMKGTANVAMKMDDAINVRFPLPDIELQKQVVAQIEKQKAIIEGADKVLENFVPRINNLSDFRQLEMAQIAKVLNGRAYTREELLNEGKYRVLRVGNFFTSDSWYYSDLELDGDKYCNAGDLLYAWSASFGAKLWSEEKVIYHYHIWKIIPNENIVLKKYLYYLLDIETQSMKEVGGRGIGMIHITKAGFEARKFPIPPIKIQHQIIEELDQQMQILEGLRKMKADAEKKIENILTEIWGGESQNL